MPPTPLVLGTVVILVLISMAAASSIGVLSRARALATVVVVAILAVPVGYLGETFAPAEGAAHEGVGGGGSPEKGQAFYAKSACPACHTITGLSAGTIGPDLTHVATVGATRKSGITAEAYIRESIANPQAFIAPGFTSPSSMPGAQATGQDLEDVIAFLMSKA
ncbi:MAG: c-type cytochrome [Chloroflexi bacterium]|nr:c-type cytochrome [Chloroflexota bacterium]